MKPLLFDGAIGTTLWEKAKEQGIPQIPVWIYNIENPELVASVHEEYAHAGADCILTNTFGINRISIAKYPEYSIEKVVKSACDIAVHVAEGKQKKVFFSSGPLPTLMEPYGDLSTEEVDEIYSELFTYAKETGIYGILLETFMDLEMLKVAVLAAKRTGLPVFATMTFEKVGKTLFGNSPREIISVLTECQVDAVGLNCSLGPEYTLSVIKEFLSNTQIPVLYKPNAGLPTVLPNGELEFKTTPEDFVEKVSTVLPVLNFVGGCCGTDVNYIKALRKAIDELGGSSNE